MSMAGNPVFWPFSSLLIQYFIKQIAQSMTNNHLSLIFEIYTVIIRDVYTKAYKYSKFCQSCAQVELQYIILS